METRGQGLALWRLTWAPEDQNCATHKCHGLGHPPDGFYMPNDAPAIIGKDALTHFRSARELYGFISKRMPFDKPGELSSDDYWAVTAFLLRENGKLPGDIRLDALTAASVVINPNVSIHADATPALAAAVSPSADVTPFVIAGIMLIWVGAARVLFRLRRNT